MQFHEMAAQEVLTSIKTTRQGLSEGEVEKRRQRYGQNILATNAGKTPLAIFLDQFKDTIIYILLVAVVFSLLIGEYIDSFIILAILTANGAIGFFQELSAQRSLESLKKIAATRARIIRAGITKIINAEDLVPGDIVLLEAGDKVPADARLLSMVRLKIAEDILTGESEPVNKNPKPISGKVQLGDRKNMAFSSTSVVSGHGIAAVIATGMDTEIGRITTIIKETEKEMTPLQRRLQIFGKRLGAVVLSVCFLVFILFVGRDFVAHTLSLTSLTGFLFIAVSLAVAAVPTALPAVVTIALSIGVKRLLAKKCLVRNLASVESLGSCDVICTDKTGTLTRNQMTVCFAWTLDGEAEITGRGYDPEGTVSKKLPKELYAIGLVCNDSSIEQEGDKWRQVGDPTEAALVVSAAKAGVVEKPSRLDELPFDSTRKLMSVHAQDAENGEFVYTKGAPDNILECCSHVLREGRIIPLTPELRSVIDHRNDLYAEQAMRVLGFAYKPLSKPDDFTEENLIFIGLQAMIDPPRIDVIDSVARAGTAGIRIIMATGDYAATALAIGREIGIHGKVCTGDELDTMDDNTLKGALMDNTNIFARVVPEHKQRIISSLQEMNHIVAMTGDGVNDAPALKKADIGVAVGSGTEVAKETADFVLLDDSFTHLINAIEEGRGIYDNIQKSIMLLLSGNLGEVLIILLAALLGLNLPLTAILLLWINMITDGAPALAFTVDPYGTDIMTRRPKPKTEKILPADKLRLIGVLGFIGTLIALTLFVRYGGHSMDDGRLILAQTMVFNFVVLYECILVFVIRREYGVPFYKNSWIWTAIVSTLALQTLLMYTPAHTLFSIVPLGMAELGALGVAGLVFYLCCRLYRFICTRGLFSYRSDTRGRS